MLVNGKNRSENSLLTQYLEDLYDGPEVADVVDGQLQVDVADKCNLILTCFTIPHHVFVMLR